MGNVCRETKKSPGPEVVCLKSNAFKAKCYYPVVSS